jgi:hypothetical protein
MKKIRYVESAMRYRQIVFLITGLLVALGYYALFVMPRQEFPSFTIRQGWSLPLIREPLRRSGGTGNFQS